MSVRLASEDGGVTTMVHPLASGGWTAESVAAIPDNGLRYELSDGNLLATPPPSVRHALTQDRLAAVLKRAAPQHVIVIDAGIGVGIGESYFIPDVVVLHSAALKRAKDLLHPADVLLVVEVLSPTTRSVDLGLKREAYAAAGIPDYWIVHREVREVTMLALADRWPDYDVAAVVKAGHTYLTDRPFPVEVDPADFC
jgi:Uma2 family endonuclease